MSCTVVFTPEAENQIVVLYRYIANKTSPKVAKHYTDAIVAYCESLSMIPHRGTCRDDIRLGLRITNYKKSAVITFAVDAEQVSIIGVFYGGQNYEAVLQND